MRGLKPKYESTDPEFMKVASFTDAWIETFRASVWGCKETSHLLQMRGLKPVSLDDVWPLA